MCDRIKGMAIFFSKGTDFSIVVILCDYKVFEERRVGDEVVFEICTMERVEFASCCTIFIEIFVPLAKRKFLTKYGPN